jgi:integrase/recombinase XerD
MKIIIRTKKISNGKLSLYLDITGGESRRKQYLKLQIFEKPKTKEEKLHNSNIMEIANKVRLKIETELQNSILGVDETKYETDFLKYFQSFIDNYKKPSVRMMKAVKLQLEAFLTEKRKLPITGGQVTLLLCEDFAEYLKTKLNYSTPSDYFKKFKQVLKRAKKENVIRISVSDIEVKFNNDSQTIRKHILSIKEIAKLTSTASKQSNISNAFIFCLNTGIDFSTVKSLTWENIKGGYLVFERSKTEKSNRIKLNENALKALPDPWPGEIFNLPSWTMCVKSIRAWAKRAGIDKKITWHTARHSLGAMMVNNLNINPRVVQDIFGHGDIKQTMRYTRILNEAKDNAIDSIPGM